jgi:hypothetical protein
MGGGGFGFVFVLGCWVEGDWALGSGGWSWWVFFVVLVVVIYPFVRIPLSSMVRTRQAEEVDGNEQRDILFLLSQPDILVIAWFSSLLHCGC